MKKTYIMMCLVLLYTTLSSQTYDVQYLHTNPLKFSLSDLSRVSIQLTHTSTSTARVLYSLLDERKNKICELDFKLVELKPGMNRLNYGQAPLQWMNSPYRDLLMRDQLVNGNFQLCVAVTDVTEVIPNYSDCFEIELKSEAIEDPLNVRPIELQSPYHKDTIEEQRPMLTWIPPSPVYQGTEYNLILTEKKANQTCVESLNNNIPIIDKKGIQANILNYPSESPSLEKGKKYCWRVSAYKNQKEYTRSEEWEFSVRGEEKKIKFYQIENINKQTIRYEGDEFYFVIDNIEKKKILNYNLEYASTGKWERIADLSKEITYGKNTMEINKLYFDKKGIYRVSILDLNNNQYFWFIDNK